MHWASEQLPGARTGAGNRFGLAGAVLVVIGLVLCVVYRYTAGDEPHSYAAGAVAPYDVGVTQGRVYYVAIHRGIDAEQELGLVPAALTCSYSVQPGVNSPLALTAEPSTSKAINVIATFVAPVTGRVHISCARLPAVFVDDADDAPADRSGLYLLLGVIALGVGVPLLLSGLRSATLAARRRADEGSGPLGQYDEVQ